MADLTTRQRRQLVLDLRENAAEIAKLEKAKRRQIELLQRGKDGGVPTSTLSAASGLEPVTIRSKLHRSRPDDA